ncbi:hypothetical protein CAOG_04837 [Capsaspora owczarzaki ATCC 30864]|uniref:Palmitoyltransferase n=1 Tax=Capsaspora owczarzaki (strain ATCC 30864) TaxID=595528 RepID=A0A0D2WS27_CAPO3|nr:hypothetical protein CAOG_04837 [Capsaspora owczarzaki ATCC 30864]KJE94153.1 hypothetical protein CAOG_004837 [Capsaspora owczarzaki ATCC 30864]|eukprot:XP_004347588.2 hypothetical protein CAOG_04837 [Capsaspora owczarzaki ATCC 30864]
MVVRADRLPVTFMGLAIVYGAVTTLWCLLPTLSETLTQPSSSSVIRRLVLGTTLGQAFNVIALLYLGVSMTFNWIMSIVATSFNHPHDAADSNHASSHEHAHGEAAIHQATHSRTFCAACGQQRPLRTHHCSACNRCIARRDHHCFFVGTCIGQENHRYFLSFLAFSWMACTWVAVLTFCLPIPTADSWWLAVAIGFAPWVRIALVQLGVLNLAAAGPVVPMSLLILRTLTCTSSIAALLMLVYQLRAIVQGQTVLERRRQTASAAFEDLGVKANLQAVLGVHPSWWYSWIVPHYTNAAHAQQLRAVFQKAQGPPSTNELPNSQLVKYQ